jgi:hypothetical protein
VDDAEIRSLVARVEELLGEIEQDERALEAVQGLVAIYGEALRRIVEAGRVPANDELVAHLLTLHELHVRPEPAVVQVRRKRSAPAATGA